jgi:hypothetical protein
MIETQILNELIVLNKTMGSVFWAITAVAIFIAMQKN